MATTTTGQPTTAQLLEALAAALLPLAGPDGILASSVMGAMLQFMTNLHTTYAGGDTFTTDQLIAAAQSSADKTTTDLNQLAADVAAQAAAASGQPTQVTGEMMAAGRMTIPTKPTPGNSA